jgi:murein DD-endopeptidase MepM/ murein hydrolase activator NlpD
MTEEYQLPPTDSSRKARLSAATLGLALSMGATSLLLPRQGDEVRAAEPPSSASTSLPTAGSSRLHVVQAGETLAQVARQHHLTLAALARANNLVEGAALQSGQVLRLPEFSDNSVAVAPPVAPGPSMATLAPPTLPDAIAAVEGPEVAPEAAPVAVEPANDAVASLPETVSTLPAQEQVAMAGLAAELKSLAAAERQTVASALAARASLTPAPRPMVVRSPDAIMAAPDAMKQPAGAAGMFAAAQSSRAAAAAAQPEALADGLANGEGQGDRTEVARVPSVAPAAAPVAAATPLRAQLPSLTSTLGQVAAGGDRAWRETLLRIQNGETDLADGPQVVRESDRHVVRPGETLSAIAQQYGVSTQALAQANGVSNPRALAIGLELQIPAASGEAVVATALTAPTASPVVAETASTGLVATPEASVSATAGATAIASSRSASPIQAAAVRPQAAAASLSTNPYLASLKAEVNSLRDRYQGMAAAQPVAQPMAQPLAAAAPRIPQATEQAPVQASAAVVAPVTNLRGEAAAITQEPPSPSYSATAVKDGPLGESGDATQLALASPSITDAQDSRVQPLLGRVVSPGLPGLSGAEAYIPGASRFSGEYAWPARGVLTSGYGWRWGRMHRGIDIAAPTGTPIMAAADGVIEFAGWNSGGFGNLVDVRHPDGSLTRYAHNSRIMVRRGQSVQQGQLIAEMGSTGRSTGPHLHFEIHRRGQGALNPIGFLPQGGLRAAR